MTAGFAEADFEAFRDALAGAETLDQLAESAGEFGELTREMVSPDIEVELHGIGAAAGVGGHFRGAKGWLDFWRGWLEPWASYEVEFSSWEEVRETVLFRLDIRARGRGSGVEVSTRVTQAWTLRDGKVTRLDIYPSRHSALAALAGD